MNTGLVSVGADTVYRSGGLAAQVNVAAGYFTAGAEDQPDKTLSVTIESDGEVVSRGFITLKPGETGDKNFNVALNGGSQIRGAAAIAPDNLNVDDRRFFVGGSGGSLSALLIDGDPGEGPFDSEVFYLERALAPSRIADSDISLRVADPAVVAGASLSDYDVIFLANVGSMPQAAAGKLKDYVAGGGGLFISLGDKTSAERINELLGDLLPRPLWGEKTALEGGEGQQTIIEPARLDPFRVDDKIFNFLLEEGKVNLRSARFDKYFVFQTGGADNSRSLLTFSDGSPALLLSDYGKGKVMLFASTIDRQWSDFAIKPVFLPIMRRAARYLAGKYQPQRKRDYLVGQKIEFGADSNYVVELPDNSRAEVERTGGRIIFTATDQPGIYNFSPLEGGRNEQLFSVNIDPAESDTDKLTASEIAALLGAERMLLSETGGDQQSQAAARQPLWGIFLLAAFGFVALEGLMTLLM